MRWIRSLSYEEQKKLWICNDRIARQNAERFLYMDLQKNLTPALLAYDGIQYTYMAPAVFEDGQYDYVQRHFRDDLGAYTAFRKLLLGYYPDRVWRTRIAEQLHAYAVALQVNYARCMTRRDTVAAGLCRSQGIQSAMELYFLLKREYPPYYKWTFRAMRELDAEGVLSGKVRQLAEAHISPDAWEGTRYHPDRINLADRVVLLAEEIAAQLEEMLLERNLIRKKPRYLEPHVNEVLQEDDY